MSSINTIMITRLASGDDSYPIDLIIESKRPLIRRFRPTIITTTLVPKKISLYACVYREKVYTCLYFSKQDYSVFVYNNDELLRILQQCSDSKIKIGESFRYEDLLDPTTGKEHDVVKYIPKDMVEQLKLRDKVIT